MDFSTLLIVAFGGAFAIAWIIHYIPLDIKMFGKLISPRLLVCKLLAPFDATITFILVCGAWVGLTASVVGIYMMVYNVLTGIGISVGVVVIKKFFIPKWTKEFEMLCEVKELKG